MSATLQAVAQRAAAHNIAERARRLVTVLNLHFAGVALLALVNLYLVIHMLYAYQKAHSQNEDAVATQTVQLKAAELGALPLEGLDAKLATANAQADDFYARRLPSAYSQFLSELGQLKDHDRVKLSRMQLGQAAVLGDTAGELTEVKMDANLAGDYRPLVTFMNHLERDRMFFLINTIALTGQQGGTVNLRMRLTTYLRPRAAGEPLPPLDKSDDPASLIDGSPDSAIPDSAPATVPAARPRPGSNSVPGSRPVPRSNP